MHAVCVIVAHFAAPRAELPVAIERPSGLLVDALVDAGHPVVAIHPNVVKACRPRYRAAAGKSDPGDAYLLARLRAAPSGCTGKSEVEINGELVRSLAALLGALVAEVARLTARFEHAVEALPDGQNVMSFPRAGRVCAAQILAELGDVRDRFPTEQQLAAEAGVCPVTHASGKRRGVSFRWACNHRLRQAVTCFADNSRHASARAAEVYPRARLRGCDQPDAVRILARAWIRVLWRAWSDRKPYDPANHRAAQNLAAAT